MDRHLRGKQVCVDGCLSQGSWGTAEMQFFQQAVKRQDNSRQRMQGRMRNVFSQQQSVCRKNQISSCCTGCQRDRQQRGRIPAQTGSAWNGNGKIKSSDGPR